MTTSASLLPDDAAIQPPGDDRLGVLTATAPVVLGARQVRIEGAAVAALAAAWAAHPWPAVPPFGEQHLADGSPRTANWVLLLDALNFCFWGEPGQPRWQVEWQGATVDGYAALAAALRRAVDEGRPLWDAAYLAALEGAELAEVLRPAAGCPAIPLFAERLAHAREVGRVLLAHYGGQFTSAVEQVGYDAVVLALLLARDFPSFADVAEWRGARVPLLKRAQICVADLHAAYAGEAWGRLRALDELTAFADYKLPQLLRRVGVLTYAPELAAAIDQYEPLTAGSEPEVEIRAATIWAVELLRRALARHGVHQTASAIDYRIWNESQSLPPDTHPYHRTRTIYY